MNGNKSASRSAEVKYVVSAEEYEGYFCPVPDTPSVFEFQAIDCTNDEFAEWYILKLGMHSKDCVDYQLTASGRGEIKLWGVEHGLAVGEIVVITTSEAFDGWRDKMEHDVRQELNRLCLSK